MAIESAPITLKYLALPNGLGGRGGVSRFFMLANNIPFEEDLVGFAEWGSTEKARLVSSGENPCGTVPVIYTKGKDDKDVHLIQHIASARYIARLHGITKDMTAYEEYVQDLVADEQQGFRNEWVTTAFTGTDEDKAAYKTDKIPVYLTKFEALYAKYKTQDTYLSVANNLPLWGDAAMFGLLRDNLLVGLMAEDELKRYPSLWGMYTAFGEIAAVKAWTDSKKE
jgi:Glutathione S-transferase, C-terminal domain